jgi:hypothetical protein
MGEFADMSLEFDDGYDEYGEYNEDPNGGHNPYKTCKYCKKPYLSWNKLNNKWRLYEQDGKLHQCKDAPKLPIDDILTYKKSIYIKNKETKRKEIFNLYFKDKYMDYTKLSIDEILNLFEDLVRDEQSKYDNQDMGYYKYDLSGIKKEIISRIEI